MAGPSMEIGMLESEEYYIEEYNINGTNDSYNGSIGYPELPEYLTFNDDSIREVILYSLMFILLVLVVIFLSSSPSFAIDTESPE
ncbi:gonadotropin-releasing hormone receptor [Trichonephila clavipes]|nr:gonadotropin-releasing hormone receptor [Trichonephila clavipes]